VFDCNFYYLSTVFCIAALLTTYKNEKLRYLSALGNPFATKNILMTNPSRTISRDGIAINVYDTGALSVTAFHGT
jgi:hypothetical protein